MMNCRTLGLLLTAATVIAAPDLAAAQPAAPQEASASADAARRADTLVQKAGRLYSDGKYEEAEEILLSAWELNPTFDVAYNLGNTEHKLKKHREAAQYLSFALRHWPLLKTVAKLKPTAEQRLAESRAQVGAVTVTVGVAGAEVLVDGKAVGRAPVEGEVFVEPGEHRVEARLEGYAPASQTVSVPKGGTAEVRLPMTMAKSDVKEAAPVANGIEGGSAATGAPVAEQPRTPSETQRQRPLERSWVPVIALGAASVVGLGVGVGTTVASNSANSEARAQQDAIFTAGGGCLASPSFAGQCAELHRKGERAGRLGDIALGSYIASGVLAAAAVTYALWPGESAEKATALFVFPEPRVDGVGFVMVSAW
ncbi:PEGA domain-containing protein [Sorangium sp. So ce321]|uniref:PEGA domain-containing protein n=1 Tax=Sorangium sp. So ce321 TaxID=3133300 RepID=UPI003F633894